MDRHNIKLYKCTMANTSAIWQQAAPTNYHLLAAQQEPYKKAESLMKNIGVFWKTGEWTIRDSREEGDRGLGRKTNKR